MGTWSILAADASRLENTNSFTFTVQLSNYSGGGSSESVTWGVTSSTANGDDFNGGNLPSSTVTFNGLSTGDTRTATITVNVSSDNDVESNEAFTVSLSGHNTSRTSLALATASATGTIQNDDALLNISVNNASKLEGNTSTTPFTFTVNRTQYTGSTNSATWTVTGSGTNAADNSDFSSISGTVSFAANEASKTITVNVNSDNTAEPDEDFTITLSNPSTNTSLGTATATGTIQNDDTNVYISSNLNILEGNAITNPATTTNFVFTVTRLGIPRPLTVDWYAVGSGSNPANTDDFIGALGGELDFAIGNYNTRYTTTTQNITVSVNHDTTVESDETFIAVITNLLLGDTQPNYSASITTASVTGTINTDDTLLAINPATVSVTEGNSGTKTQTFTVTRSGTVTSTASTQWAVISTGTNPANTADFSGTTQGTISFLANETSKTITVTVTGDTTVEPDETFAVILYAATNAYINISDNNDRSIVTITSDDTSLAIAAANAEQSEGSTGTKAFTFNVTRSGAISGTSTATWTVTGANTDDFVGTTGTVSFAANEISKTITVNVNGDTNVENDETFTVTLSGASGATITTPTATGTIRNDDTNLSIAATTVTQTEGNSGTKPFTFTVTRSGVLTLAHRADWAVTGTGTNPVDRLDFLGSVLPSGAVNFAVGETTQVISVNVNGDTDIENDQTFTVTLSNPTNSALIGTATATGTIQTDDASLAIVATNAVQGEGNSGTTPFTFTVNRTGLTTGIHAATWTVTGDSTDFVSTTGTVSFAANETSKTITVNVKGDTTVEPDESFTISLSNPTNNAAITTATAAGTITNDDTGFAIVATNTVQWEGDTGTTPFTFTVTRSGSTAGISSANWAVTGTGTNPANSTDFASTTGTVSFAANEISKIITINVNGDTTVEPDEDFLVSLTVNSQTVTATGTIKTDDTSLSISPATVTQTEGNSGVQPFTFTINRMGFLTGMSSVNWAVTGGTGIDADDFGGTLPSGTVNFFAGQTSKNIAVNIKGDTTVESNETFTVTLSNASNALIGTATATGTITNDDANLSIAATSAIQAEGNTGTTPFTFTVTRSGSTAGISSANWAVAGTGTNAANSTDFVSNRGTVSFAAGDISQTITIDVKGDTTIELDENFVVTLSNASNALIGTATAMGTVNNDDTSLAIAATSAIQAEGNTGTTPFTFTVTRSGSTAGISSANWAVAGTGTNAANSTDFDSTTGTFSFAVGETFKIITINVNGDTTVESDEDFLVSLSNASNGLITTATASGTIQTDDTSLSISPITLSATERDSGSRTFNFTVTRTGVITGISSANWAVTGTGDNPADGTDFVGSLLPSGTVSFSSGQRTKTIAINVNGDTNPENDEQFLLTLSNPINTTIETGTATATIESDDISRLAIAASNAVQTEGNTGTKAFTFTVTRTGSNSGTSSANWTVTGTGTNPIDGTDIATSTGTVSFNAGQTSQIITISVNGDVNVEPEENFLVTLSNPTGAVITTASATGTILNDDATGLAISPTNAVQTEGDSGTKAFTFTVSRTGLTTGTSSVNWAVTGSGTNAANAGDFVGVTLPSGTVSFTAGQTAQTVTVNVNGDTTIESDESFTVTLSNPFGAAITNATATGTIQNDDTSLAISPTNSLQTQTEGNSGGKAFTFVVNRDGNTSGTSSVNWVVTGGGTNATDFVGGTLPSGTVSFTAGQTAQTITINVNGDTTIESDESFTVTLSNATGGTITNATATGTIQNDDNSSAQLTQIISSDQNLTFAPGATVKIPLYYNTSNGDQTLTGISLRLHYKSSDLTFNNATGIFPTGLFGNITPFTETTDIDNDPNTDRYLQFQYTDFSGNWPNQSLPLKLADFNFTAASGFRGAKLNISANNVASGYTLDGDSIFVASSQRWNLDIDGNGLMEPLADGIIMMRYLFGSFTGNSLIDGAIGNNPTRNLSQIQTYLQQGIDNNYLDIDGNQTVGALSDGIIAIRHMFGSFPGDALTAGAVGSDATRSLTEMQTYLSQLSTI